MKKEEFLSQLEKKLSKLPKEDREEALDYYREYLEDAGEEQEETIISKLGSPDAIANNIISECAQKSVSKNPETVKGSMNAVWLVILGILASPVAFPIAFAVIALIFALCFTVLAIIGSLFLCSICCIAAGISGIIVGFAAMFIHFPTGLFILGISLMLSGVAVFITWASVQLCRLLFTGIAHLFKGMVKGGKKNEANN